MTYLIFSAALIFASIVAVLFYYTGLMLLLSPLALFKKPNASPRLATISIWGLTGIYQVLFWSLWAALCVALILKFIQEPGVDSPWVYWFTGFVGCVLLIGLITYENIRSGRSIAGIRGIQNGSTLFSLVAVMAFSAFSYNPSFGLQAYGFVLRPLGLEKYLVSQPVTRSMIEKEAGKDGQENALNTILSFFEGYDYYVRANKTVSFTVSHRASLHDLESATHLLIESRERLSGCDTDLLNRIYSRWGDLVAHNLIPSIDLHLSGLGVKNDADSISKGYRLMAEFDDWLEKNWGHIAFTLNNSYGL